MSENARVNQTGTEEISMEETKSDTEEKSLGIKILKQIDLPLHIKNVTTLNEHLYLLSSPVHKEPYLMMYRLNNFEEISKIDLNGLRVECIISESITNSIFLLNKGPVYRSICRMCDPEEDDESTLKFKPFISDIANIRRSYGHISTSALGELIVLVSNELPDLSTIHIYNRMGFISQQVSLSRLRFTGIFNALLNSRGNIVVALYDCGKDGLVELVEMDHRGSPLARYKSELYGDIDAAIGQDKHFYLMANRNEMEVVDENFQQRFRSPKPKDPLHTYHISNGMVYSRANNVLIRIHKEIEGYSRKTILTVSRLTKL